MERSWLIEGVYANWTMTVAAAPLDKPCGEEPPQWAMGNFGRLAEHFADLVNICEHFGDHEEGMELSRAVTWRRC